MRETMLNPQELTGRAATHVREVPELGSRLHAGVVQAVLQLREAAARVGIELTIVSSFRDFGRQTAIWNGKWRGERSLLDRAGQPLDAGNLDE